MSFSNFSQTTVACNTLVDFQLLYPAPERLCSPLVRDKLRKPQAWQLLWRPDLVSTAEVKAMCRTDEEEQRTTVHQTAVWLPTSYFLSAFFHLAAQAWPF